MTTKPCPTCEARGPTARHDPDPTARCAGCNGPAPIGHPDWLCDDCAAYKATLPYEGDDYPHGDAEDY